jgi:hypothetical protein
MGPEAFREGLVLEPQAWIFCGGGRDGSFLLQVQDSLFTVVDN